ncbi:MAG: hypothetical protein WC940_03590 [Candidatus Paceibacterota bacterium]|jgi:hypothetical protein
MIEETEAPKTEEEIKQENKPLLNIQLPGAISGDPNESLSIGKHNKVAQHNFQEVANILLAIINNQKIISLAIQQMDKKQKELEKTYSELSSNIKKLVKKNE